MKLSELKKMATENGISLKHLTGKMLKKSELAEKLMTKGVMVKSPKKSRKTSRKPVKKSRKPKKTSRKPVKKSRKPKKTSRKPVKKSRKPKKTSRKPVKKSRKPKKTSRKPVKKSRKPKKTSRKPKKTSRKPKKTSRKPVKKSRKPKKVRKYKARTVGKGKGKGKDIGSAMTTSLKRPTTGLNWTRSIRGGSRWRNVLRDVDQSVKPEYKLATWDLITSEIERLLTIERTTGYKIKPRLYHEKITPVVVGVRFVYSATGGWFGNPISVEICEMDIVLRRDGVLKFKINYWGSETLKYIDSLTSVSVDKRSLVDEKTITAANITKRVKTALLKKNHPKK